MAMNRIDGLACFTAASAAGCVHVPTVVGDLKLRARPEFTWVNPVLGHPKTTLAGAHHAFNDREYAGQVLAALAYRFNRRFDLLLIPAVAGRAFTKELPLSAMIQPVDISVPREVGA